MLELIFHNDTSCRSDTVVICIGSTVQENVLQFGQNHNSRHILGYIDIDITTNSKNKQG